MARPFSVCVLGETQTQAPDPVVPDALVVIGLLMTAVKRTNTRTLGASQAQPGHRPHSISSRLRKSVFISICIHTRGSITRSGRQLTGRQSTHKRTARRHLGHSINTIQQ